MIVFQVEIQVAQILNRILGTKHDVIDKQHGKATQNEPHHKKTRTMDTTDRYFDDFFVFWFGILFIRCQDKIQQMRVLSQYGRLRDCIHDER